MNNRYVSVLLRQGYMIKISVIDLVIWKQISNIRYLLFISSLLFFFLCRISFKECGFAISCLPLQQSMEVKEIPFRLMKFKFDHFLLCNRSIFNYTACQLQRGRKGRLRGMTRLINICQCCCKGVVLFVGNKIKPKKP